MKDTKLNVQLKKLISQYSDNKKFALTWYPASPGTHLCLFVRFEADQDADLLVPGVQHARRHKVLRVRINTV